MPSLKSLQERGKRRIEIPDDEEGGEPLKLAIWPNKLTYHFQDEMNAAAKDENEEVATRLFLSLVAEWNVTGSDDPKADPLPLEPDVLREIGVPTLQAIYAKVRDILTPNPPTSAS